MGIIGAGQTGGTLTRLLTALGHEVFVANSLGPQTLSDPGKRKGGRHRGFRKRNTVREELRQCDGFQTDGGRDQLVQPLLRPVA
jgi:F420-dependent NADP oxidoreductase-like protein